MCDVMQAVTRDSEIAVKCVRWWCDKKKCWLCDKKKWLSDKKSISIAVLSPPSTHRFSRIHEGRAEADAISARRQFVSGMRVCLDQIFAIEADQDLLSL